MCWVSIWYKHIQCNHAKQQQQQQKQFIAERCSGFTGAYTQISTTAATTLPGQPLIQHELDAPQPLVDRKPSVSLLRWNSGYNNNNNNINHNSANNNNNFLNIMSQQLPTTPSRSSSIRKHICIKNVFFYFVRCILIFIWKSLIGCYYE